jgi:Peptidase C26
MKFMEVVNMKKLTLGYCPMGNGDSIAPFDDVFANKQDISMDLKGVDAVIFWGGSDIHPSLYNANLSRRSQAAFKPSSRDVFEWRAMKWCIVNKIPMIGVCRGAQMLCAAAGGKLIQHAIGHTNGNHSMITSDGTLMSTTSAHHQMLYPFDVNHEVLATSTMKLSNTYLDGDDKEIDMEGKPEIEACWFPDIKGLGIQGHPEWAKQGGEFANYCNDLVREYILQLVDVEV